MRSRASLVVPQSPPPNFCAISAGLQADAKPKEGASRWQAYFAQNMTSWLLPALEARAAGLSYSKLHMAILGSQAASDGRSDTRQAPLLFCRDPNDAALEPLA